METSGVHCDGRTPPPRGRALGGTRDQRANRARQCHTSEGDERAEKRGTRIGLVPASEVEPGRDEPSAEAECQPQEPLGQTSSRPSQRDESAGDEDDAAAQDPDDDAHATILAVGERRGERD